MVNETQPELETALNQLAELETPPIPSIGTERAVPFQAQQITPIDRDRQKLKDRGWFMTPGAYILVDGQFGSTGKGLAEQLLALTGGWRVGIVTTNAGPNSGHTIYDHHSGEKIVLKQVPSFIAAAKAANLGVGLHINAGAIVDPNILISELEHVDPVKGLTLHPDAAAILPKHYNTRPSLDRIASTQKGTGPALVDKMLRKRFATVDSVHDFEQFEMARLHLSSDAFGPVFVSTAQGFSLGLNSGFYPYTTARECTVQQALADARIPARRLRKVIAVYRTYPIRVGNTDQGHSGGWYSDQREMSWDELGITPETTTVTGRQRRVATWSDEQYFESLIVNEPDALMLNFINYFQSDKQALEFARHKVDMFLKIRGRHPDFVLLGFGPRHHQCAFCWECDDMERAIARFFNDRDVKPNAVTA